MRYKLHILYIIAWLLTAATASAHDLSGTYNAKRPVVIACDWNKAPYEFLNDQGEPSGSDIDILRAIFNELHVPYRFVMKEWGKAVKTFERGEADLILADIHRYNNSPNYFCSENTIYYNRYVAATLKKGNKRLSLRQLVEDGLVLKPEDFSKYYFMAEDSTYLERIGFQSPKAAIIGLEEGDYTYFIWGEEPIKWKLKELNIDSLRLVEVNIPISEIHVIGRDKELLEAIDDHYSRMKQRGEVELINNRWLHPERVNDTTSPITLYIIVGLLMLAILLYLAIRLSKTHVLSATRESTDLNNMMYKALHMGNFHIIEYDINADKMVNHYGHILPDKGLTLQEFTNRIHPNEQQEFHEKMERLLSGREQRFDLQKRWNAGTTDKPKWLILEGHAILELDEHGHPAYIINALNNITHDVEQERNTYEMEKRYDVLSEMPIVATSFYDKEGYLIEANDIMKKLCGFKTDPKIERFWRKVCMFDIPLFRNAYSPEDRHTLYVCQHMVYPDMNIDKYIEFYVSPLVNSQNEITNYFVAVLDVSDEYYCNYQLKNNKNSQLETECQTRLLEQQLNGLIEMGDLYLWHSDINNQTIMFYRSLRGHGTIEQNFDTFISHLTESEQDVARYYLNNTEKEQLDMNVVFHFRKSPFDENEAWYNMRSTPKFDYFGNIIGHRGVLYDVTKSTLLQHELSEVTKRAEASNQLKSGFMASMTHELRTPLNAIMGFTDILRVIDSPEERTEYIRIVRNNCDMLVRLINDIFEASTITEGPDSIEPTDVDFAKSFDDICLMLEQRVTEPGLEFLKDNPYKSFRTTLDMGRIQQIITNFVTNAVKFTKQGHIKVGYRYERYGLYIYCEDTGSGIPKENQSMIFERFVKLDEYVQGTGLGLNICKSIAERCGGKIGVLSEGEGKGSTFWVWIPCKQEQ